MQNSFAVRRQYEKKFKNMSVEELRGYAKNRVSGFMRLRREFLVEALLDYHCRQEQEYANSGQAA